MLDLNSACTLTGIFLTCVKASTQSLDIDKDGKSSSRRDRKILAACPDRPAEDTYRSSSCSSSSSWSSSKTPKEEDENEDRFLELPFLSFKAFSSFKRAFTNEIPTL